MIAITADDERLALKRLSAAVIASPDISGLHEFTDCDDVLEWAASNSFDIAFLDLNMRGMGGLALAERLREIHPGCFIVFCTGYQEYALRAFEMHADGYVIKPIHAERIQKELNHILGRHNAKQLLKVRCFGDFQVFDLQDNPLRFHRNKTRELMALLVDRSGSGVTTSQMCSILWPDSADYSEQKQRAYVWNLVSDLKRTLAIVGMDSVLQHAGNSYTLDSSRMECDYYNYIKDPVSHVYGGEYMNQYSWAEDTRARLRQLSETVDR